jgi:hypothetical protein
LNGVRPVEFLGRAGGNVPSHEEVLNLVRKLARRSAPAIELDEERLANV